jgi:hypothetical protein
MLTVELVLPTLLRTISYRIESASRLLAVGQHLEYHEVTEAEVSCLGREENGVVFRLRTKPPQVQANNGIFGWANDVNAFLHDLVVLVSMSGDITQVLNHGDLRAKWPAHCSSLRSMYHQHPHADDTLSYIDQAIAEPDFLVSQIIANGLYDFLFPGLYGTYSLAEETPGSKTIPHLFGAVLLPLTLVSSVETELSGSATVRTYGDLDEEALNRDGFREFLKNLTDMHDVKTDLSADYEATYRLDRHHWLEEAETFLRVQAGGTAYSYTVARHLTIMT